MGDWVGRVGRGGRVGWVEGREGEMGWVGGLFLFLFLWMLLRWWVCVWVGGSVNALSPVCPLVPKR